ncbi:MAG: isopenicillin N synthase family dioxygenase [Rhizobiaceae bacterium]
MTEFTEIPIVDVSGLGEPSRDRAIAAEFRAAYGTAGFGYIIHHGIDQSLINNVFEASRRFHALPHEEKMAVELNEIHRGFIPINTSTDVNSSVAEVKKPNQSESFMMMREDGPDSPDIKAGAYLAGPNLWPHLEGFREALVTYHDALGKLSHQLMKVAALSIGADPADVLSAFQRPTTWLRLLHYPPAPPLAPKDLFGSAPHRDFGCLTILAQDDVGGLQVQTPAGNWVDAPAIPGSFVVNVGDMLHRWSNGILLSTPHRVINRSGRERYSCPFFYDPNVATKIAPLPCCVTPDRPAAFEPLNFGEFLRSELEAGYDKHRQKVS